MAGEVTPTGVVLLQELERFNKLIERMGKSLIELQRVMMIYVFVLTNLQNLLCFHRWD